MRICSPTSLFIMFNKRCKLKKKKLKTVQFDFTVRSLHFFKNLQIWFTYDLKHPIKHTYISLMVHYQKIIRYLCHIMVKYTFI